MKQAKQSKAKQTSDLWTCTSLLQKQVSEIVGKNKRVIFIIIVRSNETFGPKLGRLLHHAQHLRAAL